MNHDFLPVESSEIPFNTNQPHYNVAEDILHEARRCYVTAFLLHCESEEYETVINLLNRALRRVPDFLDAYYLREEVWHKYLKAEDVYQSRYLRSEAWKHKKAQVFKRDKYKCVCCYGEATDVHHRTYDNIGKELLSDLTSMCRSCHDATHARLPQSRQTSSTPEEVSKVFGNPKTQPVNPVVVPDNVV